MQISMKSEVSLVVRHSGCVLGSPRPSGSAPGLRFECALMPPLAAPPQVHGIARGAPPPPCWAAPAGAKAWRRSSSAIGCCPEKTAYRSEGGSQPRPLYCNLAPGQPSTFQPSHASVCTRLKASHAATAQSIRFSLTTTIRTLSPSTHTSLPTNPLLPIPIPIPIPIPSHPPPPLPPTHHNLPDALALHPHAQELGLQRHAPPAGGHLWQAWQGEGCTRVVCGDLHLHDAVAVCGEGGGVGELGGRRLVGGRRAGSLYAVQGRAAGKGGVGQQACMPSRKCSCPAHPFKGVRLWQQARTSVHLAVGGGTAGRGGRRALLAVALMPCNSECPHTAAHPPCLRSGHTTTRQAVTIHRAPTQPSTHLQLKSGSAGATHELISSMKSE